MVSWHYTSLETPTDLRTRKQERAREEIVAAAFALFSERGYAEVTVADIAARAEVGRTTFFRYFGDKQEVVFANEQQCLDDVGRRHSEIRLEKPPSLADAIALLRETTAEICRETTRDTDRYIQRKQLIADNPELDDRASRKQQRLAALLGKILLEQGASAQTAALAPGIALACYNAGREIAAGSPTALGRAWTPHSSDSALPSPRRRPHNTPKIALPSMGIGERHASSRYPCDISDGAGR